MARGDVDEHSDVDLSVTLPAGKTGLALGALLMDVQDLIGRRVDVVTGGCLRPSACSRVLNEAQLLCRWVLRETWRYWTTSLLGSRAVAGFVTCRSIATSILASSWSEA